MIPATNTNPPPTKSTKSASFDEEPPLGKSDNSNNGNNGKYEAFKQLQQVKDVLQHAYLLDEDKGKLEELISSANESFKELVANLEQQRADTQRFLSLGARALRRRKDAELKRKDAELKRKEAQLNKVGEFYETVVAELRERVRRDPMTKLLNREEFRDLSSLYLTIATRGIYAIGVLDIQNFKNVNDAHGHAVGDRVISKVGKAIGANIRTSCQGLCHTASDSCGDCIGVDLRGRWGGDEFVFLMTKFQSQSEVESVVERFQQAVSGDAELAELGIRLNIGVVAMIFEEPATISKTELFAKSFEAADKLMYFHKSETKSGNSPAIPVAIWKINGSVEVIRDPSL